VEADFGFPSQGKTEGIGIQGSVSRLDNTEEKRAIIASDEMYLE
jgi:hypothetical protein